MADPFVQFACRDTQRTASSSDDVLKALHADLFKELSLTADETVTPQMKRMLGKDSSGKRERGGGGR